MVVPPKTMPDWRTYKVEDVPELMWTKKALAIHGLKDPWLRNEVWRYIHRTPETWTTTQRLFTLAKTGFKLGLILAIASTVVTKVLESRDKRHHDHDDHDAAHH